MRRLLTSVLAGVTAVVTLGGATKCEPPQHRLSWEVYKITTPDGKCKCKVPHKNDPDLQGKADLLIVEWGDSTGPTIYKNDERIVSTPWRKNRTSTEGAWTMFVTIQALHKEDKFLLVLYSDKLELIACVVTGEGSCATDFN